MYPRGTIFTIGMTLCERDTCASDTNEVGRSCSEPRSWPPVKGAASWPWPRLCEADLPTEVADGEFVVREDSGMLQQHRYAADSRVKNLRAMMIVPRQTCDNDCFTRREREMKGHQCLP